MSLTPADFFLMLSWKKLAFWGALDDFLALGAYRDEEMRETVSSRSRRRKERKKGRRKKEGDRRKGTKGRGGTRVDAWEWMQLPWRFLGGL